MFKFLGSVWSKDWKGKLTLIFGALILLTSAITIPWAVITRHGDVALMKCDGVKYRCDKGSVIKWDNGSFPLSCTHDESVTSADLNEYDAARKQYNARLGQEVFGPCVAWQIAKPMPELLSSGFALRMGIPGSNEKVVSPWSSHPSGVTSFTLNKDGTFHRMAVYIRPALKGKDLPRTWLHELGHALGLDHDRLQDSIMYHTLAARPGKLSDKDIKHIKEAYKL